MKRLGALVCILMLLLTMLPASAAGAVSDVRLSQVQIQGKDLTMYVDVSDANGDPYEGEINPNMFVFSVDDQQMSVTNAQRYNVGNQGIHYVFCVDASKTLTEKMMDNVKTALTDTVNTMGANDMVTIITFGEKVEMRIANSNNKSAILQVIDGLNRDEQYTALYKGVVEGVNAAASSNNRSVVVVITDGKNDVDGAADTSLAFYTADSISKAVVNAQVPLYCIGLSDGEGVGPDATSLADFADQTGGMQYIITSDAIAECMSRVRNILDNTVVLNAELTNESGRSDFGTASTFQVGFTSPNGSFAASNQLQQVVNWSNIPKPEVAPTPTPTPVISLQIDEACASVTCPAEGGDVTITGTVSVDVGTVSKDAIVISVNGETWSFDSIGQNGSDYIFSITGYVPKGTKTLKIQAELKKLGIQSTFQYATVEMPETVTPTPIPATMISLELETTSVTRPNAGETVTISGTIYVQQGVVNQDDVAIMVNDQRWAFDSIKTNGNNYVFTASGTIAADEENLKVRAVVEEQGVWSTSQNVTVITPATVTPTPAPSLTLAMDEAEITAQNGESITISGEINVQGSIDENDLELYVNNVLCENAVFEKINDIQYQYTATVIVENVESGRMNIQARLKNQDIQTREQHMKLVAPTPTPAPEMELTLTSGNSITRLEGADVTLSGRVEILSGNVTADQLALYVNGMQWDTTFNALSDTTFDFEAVNTSVDKDVTTLAVKAGLAADSKVRTNTENVEITLIRAEVTVPPTAEPTATPVPEVTEAPVEAETETNENFFEKVKNMVTAQIASWREQGTLWIWLGGGIALLILIIVLIIVGVMAHRKNKISKVEIKPENFTIQKDPQARGTVFEDPTKNTPNNAPTNDETITEGGTVNPGETYTEPSTGTQMIDDIDPYSRANAGGSTVMVEEEPRLQVELSEHFVDRRNGLDEPRMPRMLMMRDGESIMFGRSDEADQMIEDKTVSSRHMRLTCEGDALYIEDVGSSNGTKVNGVKIPANEPRRLNENDMILIGRTTLTVTISKLDQ